MGTPNTEGTLEEPAAGSGLGGANGRAGSGLGGFSQRRGLPATDASAKQGDALPPWLSSGPTPAGDDSAGAMGRRHSGFLVREEPVRKMGSFSGRGDPPQVSPPWQVSNYSTYVHIW